MNHKIRSMITAIFSVPLFIASTIILVNAEETQYKQPELTKDFLEDATVADKNGEFVEITKRVFKGNSGECEQTSIYLYPEENGNTQQILNNLQALVNNKFEHAYDATYSVYAWTRIYYTENSNAHEILLTSVEGGYSIVAAHTAVTGQTIDVGCTGGYQPATMYQSIQNLPVYGSSWSYTCPSNWIAVSTLDVSIAVGCTYNLSLQRTTNYYNWSMSLVNRRY